MNRKDSGDSTGFEPMTYYCIATQFFRFGDVVSARCTGHIDTPEILKRYLLIAKRIGHLLIIFNLFFTASPGVCFSKDPKALRARKAIRKTPTRWSFYML